MSGNRLATRAVDFVGRRARASLALAAALVVFAPGARAQSVFFPREPSPERLEYMLESSGYELRSDLIRRGDVYLADVVTDLGDHERLVIEARTGRILERFPFGMRRWREARLGDWRDPDDAAPSDWGYGDAPPRPPRSVRSAPQGDKSDDGLADRERTQHAPTDPSEASSKPNVILGPDAASAAPTTDADKSKAKTKIHVAHKKKPVVASLAPPDKSALDATKPIADSPKPSPNDRPAADLKPITAPATTPEKSADPAIKPVAQGKPAPEAKVTLSPEPRPEKKTKPVNDVPVDPLD